MVSSFRFCILFGWVFIGLHYPAHAEIFENQNPSAQHNQEMSEIIEKHLAVIEEMHQLLDIGSREQAEDLFTHLEESLEIIATWSGYRQNVARGIITRTSSDDKANRISNEFLQATQSASSTRMELPSDWLAYTEGSMTSEKLAEKTEELLKSHETLIAKGKEIKHYQSKVELPLMGGIYGPDKITSSNGTSIEAEFMLENYGNDRFHSLNIWVESARDSEATPLEISPENVSNLDPGNVIHLTISGQADQLEDDMLYLTVEGDHYRDQKLIRINQE